MTSKVVHVFGAMDRGGAELRTLGLLDLVPGVSHVFVTLSGRRGVLADSIEQDGGLVLPCRLDITFPWRFVRLLRQVRPDIVHSNVATFSGIILALAFVARVPRRIAHFRSDGDMHDDRFRRRVQRGFMRQLIRVCATDVVGGAPQALAFGWPGRPGRGRRVLVLPDGVVPSGVAPFIQPIQQSVKDSQIRLVHIARTLESKRRPRAVEILGALAQHGLDARLSLVGVMDAQEQLELERLAATEGVSDQLTFTGPVSDVSTLVSEATALLVTSTREGLPGVVLEALAHGCPVVSTDLPGVRFIDEYCVGLVTVGVDADDETWITAITEVTGPDFPTRPEIWRTLCASPFTMDRAASSMRLLWQIPA